MRPRSTADDALTREALEADVTVVPRIRALVEDRRFRGAAENLDVEKLARTFDEFTKAITRYNDFHRRERRLWSIKLGKGTIPPDLEEAFKKEVPQGRRHFKQAFSAADRCLELVEKAGFNELVNDHVGPLARDFTFNEQTVLGQAAVGYFRRIGCSTPMIEEFKHHYRPIGYDFVGKLGQGEVSNLREFGKRAVDAQLEILDHTEKHGFDYLRGAGPPAWAVAASQILAAVGISIGAWVIVAIVAVIVITLAIICAIFYSSFPPVLQAGCVLLAALGLIGFVW